MKKAVLTVLLILTLGGIAGAAQINGSLPFSFFNAGQNGADIGSSTVFTDTNTLTSGAGAGDYSVVPIATDYGPLSLDLTTVAAGGGVMITNATYGTFTASFGEVIDHTANFLDVYLTGTYTGLPGFMDTPSSFRIQFNQSGTSLSGAATLASPPASIPEPATLAFIGMGLVGLTLFRRKKA